MSYSILIVTDEHPRRYPFVIRISENEQACSKPEHGFRLMNCDELPENCYVGADAIEVGWNTWKFQEPDFRPVALEKIGYVLNFDIENFIILYDLNRYSIDEAKAYLSGDNISKHTRNVLKENLKHRRDTRKRMDKQLRENNTLNALVGGEEHKTDTTLLTLTTHEINAAQALVEVVSKLYGEEGLTLMENYFLDGKHFYKGNSYIVLPTVDKFNPGLKLVKATK